MPASGATCNSHLPSALGVARGGSQGRRSLSHQEILLEPHCQQPGFNPSSATLGDGGVMGKSPKCLLHLTSPQVQEALERTVKTQCNIHQESSESDKEN
ncbi:hypothetical protein PAL_GLEAN10009002 [Pteropus alecto]|uniref:Uncharacterized protein n=1 Tax=Pteropus alecto TaxID=9402 RepID=L5KMN7_PTEAL|nr:hypothetical protein PAL_GLEAN10009002 [Pteropus alecto]